MTFANDPAVLRLAEALGVERRAAARVVRALVDVAAAAAPWIDGRDVAVTTKYAGDGDALLAALRRARLVVGGDGEIDLSPVEGERLRLAIEEERESARARKQASREEAAAVTFRDHSGTSRDQGVTTAGHRVTTCSGGEQILPENVTENVTRRDGSCASPITRAPGEGARPRGNLLPPTPPATTSDASTRPATISDLPDPEDWLHEIAKRRGWRLDRVQRRELIGHMEAGMSPDTLEALLNQAADNDQRRMVWIRPALRREMERLAAEGEDESRGPPLAGQRGANDPIPIAEIRLIREHEAGEPPGGMYEW